MNKNAKEKELLEEAYTSIYNEALRPVLGSFEQTWEGGLTGPHPQVEDPEPQENETSSPSEDNEIEALIAADIGEDNEDDVDVDVDEDTDAEEFDAEEATGYA